MGCDYTRRSTCGWSASISNAQPKIGREKLIQRRISVINSTQTQFAIGFVVSLLAALACSSETDFTGTVLDPAILAPSFDLRDQFNELVSMKDLNGEVVLVSFLYTNCSTQCPSSADSLRKIYELLGHDSNKVDFIVLSVDPKGDTIMSAHEYSIKWNMLHKWSFLVGTDESLRPIWNSYHLEPVYIPSVTNGNINPNRIQHDGEQLEGLASQILAEYEIVHSAPIYLLDQSRRIRILFTPPLNSESITHDIKMLLN